MPNDRRRPTPIADLLAGVLADAGIRERVAQAAVVPEWAALVGPQIAAVTEPLSVSVDGTLWVAVATHAWMTELQAMEPELLRSLNGAPDGAPGDAAPERPPVARIRLVHQRPGTRPA